LHLVDAVSKADAMSRRAPRFDNIVSNALSAKNTEVPDALHEALSIEVEPDIADPKNAQEPSWGELQSEATAVNKQSLECVRRGSTKEAFEKLYRAQELLSQAERYCPAEKAHELATARAAMESSFAICHKREGNHAMVVRHLETALELHEAAGADHRTLMATRLNLSASYAEAQMPLEALQNATAAVAIGGQLIAQPLAQEKGVNELARPQSARARDHGHHDNVAIGGLGVGHLVGPDDYAMLAVAYHKSAEAHERLKQWGQATLAYTQAYEVVRRSLGPTHHLTKAFEKSARCPRRPTPPEVPLDWRVASSETKRLPNLPHIQRTPRHSAAASTPRKVLTYKLDSTQFPSWPPKAQSEEENAWYTMARQDRKQKKIALLNQIQDARASSKQFSGHLSSDPDVSLNLEFLGDRNVATQMRGSRLAAWA
jgi:tetratricopeptide (TPR) repeat protein